MHDKIRACIVLENTCSYAKHVTFDACKYKCTVVFWYMGVNIAFFVDTVVGRRKQSWTTGKHTFTLFVFVGVCSNNIGCNFIRFFMSYVVGPSVLLRCSPLFFSATR